MIIKSTIDKVILSKKIKEIGLVGSISEKFRLDILDWSLLPNSQIKLVTKYQLGFFFRYRYRQDFLIEAYFLFSEQNKERTESGDYLPR